MRTSNYNPFSLAGKTVLVTGASSGIGRAAAVECSKLGARVVVTGRNAGRLQETFGMLDGEGHLATTAELASPEDRARLAAECPSLDGLALCAGVSMTMPFALSTCERFEEVFRANFTAPTELLRLLLKSRKIADSASVVFVSSVAAERGGTAPGNTAYAASKASLAAVGRHLVREFSGRGIRFNSVDPGTVNTPLAEKIREKMTREQIDADIASYPLGRYGEPDDVAHAISYLLSDASSWVTGQRLVVDGGLTV